MTNNDTHTFKTHKAIALEARLRDCKNVITLGAKPDFSAYNETETRMIREAKKIYYPTTFYADLFDAMGKEIFPSYHTYKCVQDKIKQTALFQLLEIPHPRTRVFYGTRQKKTIPDHFDYPFIAKIPRGSALGRGVFLIENESGLNDYLNLGGPAYIQRFIPIDHDIRVIIIGNSPILAYRREPEKGEFRCNIAAGGKIFFDNIPDEAVALAVSIARKCGFNDVGIDICRENGNFYVLEANMKYGKQGLQKAGIDYPRLMETLIDQGKI